MRQIRDQLNIDRLSVEPLLAILAERGETIVGVFGFGSAESRYVMKAKQRGWLTAAAADRLCVTFLRLHPATVFGDAFWENAA